MDLPRDDAQIRRCFPGRYSWLQPPYDTKHVVVERGHYLFREFVIDGSPELRTGIRKLEPCRHDADDCIRLGIDVDGAVQDGWISAESTLPQARAQHHCAVRRGTIVCRCEAAAQCWLDSECGEQIPGDMCSIQCFRQLTARRREVSTVVSNQGQTAEAGVLSVPHSVDTAGNLVVRKVAATGGRCTALVERQQPIRIGERQRPKQNAAYYRKQRDAGTDAKCSDENGDDRESRCPG